MKRLHAFLFLFLTMLVIPAFAQMNSAGKMVSAPLSSEILGQDLEFAVYLPWVGGTLVYAQRHPEMLSAAYDLVILEFRALQCFNVYF